MTIDIIFTSKDKVVPYTMITEIEEKVVDATHYIHLQFSCLILIHFQRDIFSWCMADLCRWFTETAAH